MLGTVVWSSHNSTISCTIPLKPAPVGLSGNTGVMYGARQPHRLPGLPVPARTQQRAQNTQHHLQNWTLGDGGAGSLCLWKLGLGMHITAPGCTWVLGIWTGWLLMLAPTGPSLSNGYCYNFPSNIFFLNFHLFIVYVWVFSLHAYLYTMYMQYP